MSVQATVETGRVHAGRVTHSPETVGQLLAGIHATQLINNLLAGDIFRPDTRFEVVPADADIASMPEAQGAYALLRTRNGSVMIYSEDGNIIEPYNLPGGIIDPTLEETGRLDTVRRELSEEILGVDWAKVDLRPFGSLHVGDAIFNIFEAELTPQMCMAIRASMSDPIAPKLHPKVKYIGHLDLDAMEERVPSNSAFANLYRELYQRIHPIEPIPPTPAGRITPN